ncbi:Dual specificity tyrosine-phosphorylation-regulated kinase, partial [Nowakowskiella sp. JEL0078]
MKFSLPPNSLDTPLLEPRQFLNSDLGGFSMDSSQLSPDSAIQQTAKDLILSAWNDSETAPVDIVTFEAGSQISAPGPIELLYASVPEGCSCSGCLNNNILHESGGLSGNGKLLELCKKYNTLNDYYRMNFEKDPQKIVYYVPPWVIPLNGQNMYRLPLELQKAKIESPQNTLQNDEIPEVFPLVTRDSLDFRYEIIKPLGSGWCGRVVHAYDHKVCKHVAVKIHGKGGVRQEAADAEEKILMRIMKKDPKNDSRIIKAFSSFEHLGHKCLVTELLGPNLLDLIEAPVPAVEILATEMTSESEDQSSRKPPLTMSQIRSIAEQLFHSLLLLRKLGLVHGDIKPENVLTVVSTDKVKKRSSIVFSELRKQVNIGIKLIDFGTSSSGAEQKGMYLGTRFYRSPEVVWGSDVSPSADVWSCA